MNKKIIGLIIPVLILSSISISVHSTQFEIDAADLNIAVSILPFVEWVNGVGGEHVEVLSLIPQGQSPHIYAPTTTELTFVSTADAWFQAGLIEFDRAHETAILDAAGFSASEIVNFSSYVELIEMAGHHHHEEQVESEEEHQMDPHIWLSPSRAVTCIELIRDKLIDLDPTNTIDYTNNAADYIADLASLNNTINQILAPIENRHMLIFHPSWGYFCDDYNLTMVALEEDGKDPSSEHYAEVLDIVAEHNISIIFIQEQVSSDTADAFAKDACVEVIQLNPLASDYINNINTTAFILAENLDQLPTCATGLFGFTIIGLFTFVVSIFALIKIKHKRQYEV